MSLVFPTITPGITNIVLIDNSVKDYQVFVDAVNDKTLPILYSPACSKQELLDILTANFQSIHRMAFIFESREPYLFLDNAPLFVLQYGEEPLIPCDENSAFLIAIINQFQIQNIDFLACDTLNLPNWKAFYDFLSQSTNGIVGASNDATGNILYGGDWTMETTGEDIDIIYFTEGIKYYTYLLTGSESVYSAYFVSSTGNIFACGRNNGGQLGIGNTTNTSRPRQHTPTNTTGFTPVYISSSGSNGSFVSIFKNNSTGVNRLFGCGQASNGQMAGINGQDVLTSMTNDTGAIPIAVACGTLHTIVLMSNGTVYCCGYNQSGQFGTGQALNTSNSILTIIPNPVVSSVTLIPIQIAVGSHNTFILYNNSSTKVNSIYACGNLTNYAAAQNLTTNQISMVLVTNSATYNPIQIATSNNRLILISSTGLLYGCGVNNTNQLGIGGSPVTTLTNIPIPGGLLAASISLGVNDTYVITTNNLLYVCGYNNYGQLGLGTTTIVTTLTLSSVAGKTPVAASSPCESTGFLIMSDGTVYSAGRNDVGQLGINTTGGGTNPTWTRITTDASGNAMSSIVLLPDAQHRGYSGSLANLRVVVGTSVYDPTATSLTLSKFQLSNVTNTKLLFIGNTYTDNSTAAHTIAQINANDGGAFSTTSFPTDMSYSYVFTGSNNLSISPTDISFGLADYTIEFWFNTASFAATIMPLGTLVTNGLNIRLVSSTTIQLDSANVNNVTYTVPTMTVNTWINVIFVRKLQTGVYTHACFVNGIKNTANTFGTSLTTNFSGATTTIGSVSGFTYTGYLANIRIIVGTAVYDPAETSLAATLPRTLLSSVTNTKLLLLGSAFTDGSSPAHTITNTGTVTVSNIVYPGK